MGASDHPNQTASAPRTQDYQRWRNAGRVLADEGTVEVVQGRSATSPSADLGPQLAHGWHVGDSARLRRLRRVAPEEPAGLRRFAVTFRVPSPYFCRFGIEV